MAPKRLFRLFTVNVLVVAADNYHGFGVAQQPPRPGAAAQPNVSLCPIQCIWLPPEPLRRECRQPPLSIAYVQVKATYVLSLKSFFDRFLSAIFKSV